jgi:hypothetical protein
MKKGLQHVVAALVVLVAAHLDVSRLAQLVPHELRASMG